MGRTRQPLFMDVLDVARGKKFTPADKLILLYLAWRQGRNGESWPGLRTISRDLDISVPCVLQAVERLCNSGLVEKTAGRQGRTHSHHYSVRLDKRSPEFTFSKDEKGHGSLPLDAETDSKKRSTPFTEKVNSVEQKDKGRSHRREEGALAPIDASPGGAPAKTPRPPFIPPTVEEVREYAESRGLPDFDAGKFVEYYAAADWHDGRGNPVRSWRQKFLAVWEKNAKAAGEPVRDGYTEFGTHEATEEDIARLEKLGVFKR